MRLLLLLAFLLPLNFDAQANSEIEELFEVANKVKSSDIELFEATVNTLRSKEEILTREQFFYLEYLTGYLYGFKGKASDALSYYYNAYKNTSDRDLKVISMMSIVNYRGIARDFHSGYIEAGELLSIIPTASQKVQLNATFVLAIFYNLADENKSASDLLQQIEENALDPRQLCIFRSTKLEAHHKLGVLDNISSYEEAVDTCDSANEPILVGISTLLKAQHLVGTQEPERAIQFLEGSEQLFLNSKYPRIIAEFYSSYAEIKQFLGYFQEAIDNAQKSLSFTTSLHVTQPRVQAYKVLSEVYEQYGQLDESLKYYKLYAEAEKAFLDETKAKQLAIQQAKIESIEKTNQIALLDKENAVLKAEARAGKEEQLNAQLTAGMLALLALATLMWAYKNRRMHIILRHKAQTDQLTKIANRSHFSAESERLLTQRKLVKTPVAFIIFDLDLFKQVNDNHGHIVGDWVLTNAVQAVKPILRATDKFGRMGGEEFAIMLAECDAKQAQAVAEDCRHAIETMNCSPSGASFKVTASFGVADSTACGYDFDKLYGCADEALYQSKHAGRNRVYLYHSETKVSAQTALHA
jgi:diguanylate cyclase (GGDEF)-like protein